MKKKLLSIVLPSYNEEQNVSLIYRDLLKYIDTKKFDYEIIFVNDGSQDTTWLEISKLADKDKSVRGINFSRNFGHHAALEAGLLAAKGDVVIMMDADMQHPPELIPELLEKWQDGFDVVNTVRLSTEKAGLLKNITSSLFYRVLNSLSGLQLRDGEADFRLISRVALDSLNSLPETPKFYRGLINWIGFKVGRIEFKARARKFGKSSYTLKKMVELARIGLTSFSMKPLKFIIAFGSVLVVGAFASLVVMLVVKLFIMPEYFSNNAILVMSLVLITGVLTSFQGIMAVYLVDIYNTAKGRPSYIILGKTDEKIGK